METERSPGKYRGRKRLIGLLLLLSVFYAGGMRAGAQAGQEYVVLRAVMGSGGPVLIGNQVQVQGTAGQPLVGHAAGGEFVVTHGYWAGIFGAGRAQDGTLFVPYIAR